MPPKSEPAAPGSFAVKPANTLLNQEVLAPGEEVDQRPSALSRAVAEIPPLKRGVHSAASFSRVA